MSGPVNSTSTSTNVQAFLNEFNNDKCFISYMVSIFKKILADDKIDSSEVLQIMVIITNTYNKLLSNHKNLSNKKLTSCELQELIKKVYDSIIDKLESDEKITITPEEKATIDVLIDTGLQLVITDPLIQKVSGCFSKIFSGCFKADTVESIQPQHQHQPKL